MPLRVAILGIGCDTDLRDFIGEFVSKHSGIEFKPIENIRQGLATLARSNVGMVVLRADENAIAEMERFLHAASEATSAAGPNGAPVVVMSDQHSPRIFQKAIENGAAACLFRPVQLNLLAMYLEFFTLRSRHAHQNANQEVKTPSLKPITRPRDCLHSGTLVRRSLAMNQLVENISRVAPTNHTILFEGECGSGKTHLAETAHRLSNRAHHPFIHIPCGELSDGLINSELFGHVRGAFTGADSNREGFLSQAKQGTAFFDEVDCLALNHQSKLLRVVEKRKFSPLGSKEVIPVRARFVVAANRSLKDLADRGEFRQDLFHRLNVICFRVPPLREHIEDLPALAEHFLSKFEGGAVARVEGIDSDALQALCAYSWPGNVRQLQNVLIRAATLCRGPVITLGCLPEEISAIPTLGARAPLRSSANGKPLGKAKQDAEKQMILDVLTRNNGNRAATARELNISRAALYKKLKKMGVMKRLESYAT